MVPTTIAPRTRRVCCAAVLLLNLAVAPQTPGAEPRPSERVHIILSQTTPPYLEFARALELALRQRTIPVAVEQVSLQRYTAGAAPGIWVGVGTLALQRLGSDPPNGPVLFALVPRESLYQAVREADWRLDPARFTAVYIDQPVRRHIALIRAALPDARRIVALPVERAAGASLWTIAAEAGFELQAATLDDPQALVSLLQEHLPGADAVLALPDPRLMSGGGVQNLLLATYRHGVPVFAHSASYVRAGASFAVYSTPQQFGRQAADVLANYLDDRTRALPGPMYPRDFKVAVNARVTASLGLPRREAEALKAQLLSFETKHTDE